MNDFDGQWQLMMPKQKTVLSLNDANQVCFVDAKSADETFWSK